MARARRGFTLIEMLVVLAIVALLSALAFPAIDRALDARRTMAAHDAIGLALRTARAEAMRGGVMVAFDGAELAERAVAAGAPADSVRVRLRPLRLSFHPDGSATAGSAELEAGGRTLGWQVAGDTGLVRQTAARNVGPGAEPGR